MLRDAFRGELFNRPIPILTNTANVDNRRARLSRSNGLIGALAAQAFRHVS